jgi:hypothetical protein
MYYVAGCLGSLIGISLMVGVIIYFVAPAREVAYWAQRTLTEQVVEAPTPTPESRSAPVKEPNPSWTAASTALTPSPSPILVREITVPEPTPAIGTREAVPLVIIPTAAEQSPVRVDFTAADWLGGFQSLGGVTYGRPWTAIYGAASDYPRARLTFDLDAAPTKPATLVLTGLDDHLASRSRIAINVNCDYETENRCSHRRRIFLGPSPFENANGAYAVENPWTSIEFAIPAGLLRTGENSIWVANLAPTDNFNSTPFVLLGDATLETFG